MAENKIEVDSAYSRLISYGLDINYFSLENGSYLKSNKAISGDIAKHIGVTEKYYVFQYKF